MFPISSIEDLQKISKQVKWQYFEKLVGWIFEQNDFKVRVNLVSKSHQKGEGQKTCSHQKHQYDVVAEKFNKIFIVDCKKWAGKRYKSTQLKYAVEKHLERCSLIGSEKEKIPLIVTLMDEDIQEHKGVPIVPVDKLNTFLNIPE